MGNRLNNRKQIVGPVLQLADQYFFLLFGRLAFGYIDDGSDNRHSAFASYGAQPNLDGEFATIFAQPL